MLKWNDENGKDSSSSYIGASYQSRNDSTHMCQ